MTTSEPNARRYSRRCRQRRMARRRNAMVIMAILAVLATVFALGYYKTCPDCGAHLDPGERCDCKDDTKEDCTNVGNENQD